MINTINEIEKICINNDFMNRKVMPYGYGVKVEELVKSWKGYNDCDSTSQEIIRSEIAGFQPILNEWIEQEKEPLIKIKAIKGTKKGEILSYHRTIAELLIDSGMAVFAEGR